MPTALQGFRENDRERRGVGPPCQHSRAFSASGKGLKRWPLILSPTLRSALLRASRRTATSETEPAAILRDGTPQVGCRPTCVLDVPISGKPEIGAPPSG